LSPELTIVGASARAAAFSAARAGYAVHAADLFADADLLRVCATAQIAADGHALATILAGPQQGGWMYTGGLENKPSLVDRLARGRPLLGNSGQVLRRVRSPERVAAALARARLPSVEARSSGDSLPRDGTWLRKPLRSAGGSDIARWDDRAAATGTTREFYFQKYIEGMPCSAVYVAAGGQAALLGMTRQLIGVDWTGANGFRYCGSLGPLAVSTSVREQLTLVGSTLAREFGLVGLFGVDAIVNQSGAWSVEVNPRYTASVEIVEATYGVQAIAMHVAACRGQPLDRCLGSDITAQSPGDGRVFGKAIVFASRAFVVGKAIDELWGASSALQWPEFADIPASGTRIDAGWPIATVFAVGDSERAAIEALRYKAMAIHTATDES
jgi:uncharacterized protein